MDGAPPPAIAAIVPQPDGGRIVIDLMPQTPLPACPERPGGEIVVCAQLQEQEQFRLRPLDPRFASQATAEPDNRLRATIGGTDILADTEAALLAGGVTSQRVMVRARIRF